VENNLTKHFDYSGRVPREGQVEILDWISETYSLPRVAFQAGTGTGKAACGVSIMLEYRGIYIVPTNILMDQLIRDYPDINYLKGVEHYTCSRLPDNPELTCADAKEVYGDTCSTKCKYQESVQRCLDGEPTFVNPFSYTHIRRRDGFQRPKVIVVDECHKLIDSFMLMSGIMINKKYGRPKELTAPSTIEWLATVKDKMYGELKAVDKKDEAARYARLSKRYSHMAEVRSSLITNSSVYIVYAEDDYTHIKPIRPPNTLVQNFFDVDKVVLMSATINQPTLDELIQREDVLFKEFGSPIPVNSRLIKHEPAAFAMNYKTPPKLVAAWIKQKMRKYPGRNTIVHLTYKDVQEVKKFFPDCIANTKETKNEYILKFKSEGGLFLAAACQEGLDLPGDECRLNLIPRLAKPNMGDPVVKKKLAQENGEEWYRLQILDTLIQQAGRSTRGVEDSSVTIVGDQNLKWYWGSVHKKINQDFNKVIRWGRRY